MTTGEVREARLKRRADRLRAQRDHWKREHDKLHEFLASFPFYTRERERLEARRVRVQRHQELEQRCKEQAALIERLTPEPAAVTK